MQEVLFTNSPIDLVLSIIALVLSIAFPFTLGMNAYSKQLPTPLHQLVLILIHWNITAIIGNLLFSDPEYSVAKQILFGIQAIAWVQLGYATYRLVEITIKLKIHKYWRIHVIIGIISVIVATALFCIIPDTMASIFSINIAELDQRPVFLVFTLIFMIFVVPLFASTCYKLLKNCLQTSDMNLMQISAYMLGILLFFTMLPTLFDFILPIAYSFNMPSREPHFLQWYQFCTVFLATSCSQYFTSISYKNKSSHWFLNDLIERINDGLIYYDSNGKITFANPASLQLLQSTEEDIQETQIQDLIPNIDIFCEGTHNNVKVQIKNELHTFSVSIFVVRQTMTTNMNVLLLTDQTNLLFYQQRIKTLNRQFAEYKQDLIRYQDRLDISEKKSKESENINATLINALPFQFWSKNENGVYLTQNHKDITMRGNLQKTTDSQENISNFEIDAREQGQSNIHTSFENAEHQEITEDEANVDIKNEKPVYVYQNHFIPIVVERPPYKVIGLKIDMTEEKRLERERNMLREQKIIHSRLEELGTICGAFAHDYNNILASQIGFCELAQEMLMTINKKIEDTQLHNQIDNANKFVKEATKAATRGKESLNVLLDTVRGKANSQIVPTEFSPTDIVRDVVQKLTITLPPNIKIVSKDMDNNLKIMAQAPSLDRILSNLSNNAIYAMKKNGGTLTFKVEHEILSQQLSSPYAPPVPTGDYVKITIADTGTGMDTATLERIYSPFFTTKAPGEGLGLGLSSAVRLLKEGNAYFQISTTVGKGTTFYLYWSLYSIRNNEHKE